MPTVREYRPLTPAVKKELSESRKLRNALEKEGLTHENIAKKLKEGTECEKPYFDQGSKGTIRVPDNANRSRALEMVVKIGDGFPSTKHEIEENRNVNIHITMETATRAIEAANMEVIDIDAMEDNEFLK